MTPIARHAICVTGKHDSVILKSFGHSQDRACLLCLPPLATAKGKGRDTFHAITKNKTVPFLDCLGVCSKMPQRLIPCEARPYSKSLVCLPSAFVFDEVEAKVPAAPLLRRQAKRQAEVAALCLWLTPPLPSSLLPLSSPKAKQRSTKSRRPLLLPAAKPQAKEEGGTLASPAAKLQAEVASTSSTFASACGEAKEVTKNKTVPFLDCLGV